MSNVIRKKEDIVRFLMVDSRGNGRAILETDGTVVTRIVRPGDGEEPDEWDDMIGSQQRRLNSSYMTAVVVPNNHETLERPAK